MLRPSPAAAWIPGEDYYRLHLWYNRRACRIPEAFENLLSFRFECFVALKYRMKLASAALEYAKMAISTEQHRLHATESIPSEFQETLVWYLHRWHKLIDPDVPDPVGDKTGDLEKKLEENKALFDQALKISPG